MDQHRNVLAIDKWGETQMEPQTEKARLRDQLEQLHKTVDRLHALLPEYQELVNFARRNLQDAYENPPNGE